MKRILVLWALLAMVPALGLAAQGLAVTEQEAVITGIGGAEWRIGQGVKEEGDRKKEIKEILMPSPDSPLASLTPDARIKQFEDKLEEYLTKRAQTALNPFLVVNPQAKDKPADKAVVEYGNNAGAVYPVKLRIGDAAAPEDIAIAKTALGVADEKTVTGGGKAYQMETMNGLKWVRFDDVKLIFSYQKTAGDISKNRGDPDDANLYDIKTLEFAGQGKYMLESPARSDAYAPPQSFDPGVNKSSTQQAVSVAANAPEGKGDVRMEVVVRLQGKVAMGDTVGELDSATPLDLTKDFKCPCVSRSFLYVEDYTPPLPAPGGSGIKVSDFQKSTAVTGAKVGYAFAIPAVRHYKDDRTGASTGIDPNAQPTPLYGYPNGDGVDRDGYPGADYTWTSLSLKSDNPQDDALNKTLNYEVGMSLGNRCRYVLDPSKPNDENSSVYMYWIPPRKAPGASEPVGPYCGKVRRFSGQEVGGDEDVYSIDRPVTLPDGSTTTTKEFFSPFYKPVNYRNDPGNLDGLCKEVARMTGDPGEEIQSKRKMLKGSFPSYPNIAGISVKWNRECVQGITMGGTIKTDPTLNMAPYTMILPFGFNSYENDKSGRFGSFDSSTEPENPKGGKKSIVGTESEGTSAPDSFFKINAADCCSNDVVIASGTYGTEDNIKPTPLLKIEEADVRPNMDKPLVEVATVPNGPTGSGDPLGEYDYDLPYSRIHDSSVPVYPPGGSGVQGVNFKGYGNFSNNADVWDGRAQLQTLQNPADRNAKSFLRCRLAENEPPIDEDRRCKVTIAAEDNVTPAVDPPSPTDGDGRVRYPIAYLGYNFYYVGDDANAQLTPDKVVLGGTVVNADPAKDKPDSPKWEKAPATTFEYNFRKPGWYVVEVIAIDRNANKRTMIVPVEVARVASKFRALDVEGRRGD